MTTCPQCRAPARKHLDARDENRHITAQVFTFWQCSSCGLIFLHPVPENLDVYYPESYYVLPEDIDEYIHQIAFQQYKVDLVQRYADGGTLLEIGPGPGDFALLAKRAGYDVQVIEMDERCCEFLREKVGVQAVHDADTVRALQALGKFDVIALWHVIEHLPDPWSVLDALAEHAKPGAILILAAPNPHALQFRLFGGKWTHLDAPRHLELIPPGILTQRLERSGWNPRLLTTTDPGSLGWNIFGWTYSLRNCIGQRRGLSRIGSAISRLVAPLERRGLNGCTFTAIYQRSSS